MPSASTSLAVGVPLTDHAPTWLFTKYGFFSAVCARQGDGAHGSPVDPDRIMVRARRREHLERLIAAHSAELGGAEVHESPGTDYRFRVFVDKTVWAEVMKRLVLETDYDNFKSAVGQAMPDERGYQHALHDIWSVTNRLQVSGE